MKLPVYAKEIIREAQQKAQDIIAAANKTIEQTIREIRENQAEKEKPGKYDYKWKPKNNVFYLKPPMKKKSVFGKKWKN